MVLLKLMLQSRQHWVGRPLASWSNFRSPQRGIVSKTRSNGSYLAPSSYREPRSNSSIFFLKVCVQVKSLAKATLANLMTSVLIVGESRTYYERRAREQRSLRSSLTIMVGVGGSISFCRVLLDSTYFARTNEYFGEVVLAEINMCSTLVFSSRAWKIAMTSHRSGGDGSQA
jgi:hypothetical protein